MNKIEVFLPLAGMTAAMDAYFKKPHVFYLDGLPTGPELPAGEFTESELVEFAFEAASTKVTDFTIGENERYFVDKNNPFVDKFLDDAGEFIGWEFEFEIYTR